MERQGALVAWAYGVGARRLDHKDEPRALLVFLHPLHETREQHTCTAWRIHRSDTL